MCLSLVAHTVFFIGALQLPVGENNAVGGENHITISLQQKKITIPSAPTETPINTKTHTDNNKLKAATSKKANKLAKKLSRAKEQIKDLQKNNNQQHSGSDKNNQSEMIAKKGLITNYQYQLLAWIERHKNYPRSAKNRRLQGEAILAFKINRNGKLTSYNVVKSSGYSILDKAVIDTIKQSEYSPLPKVPVNYPEEKLSFKVPVKFAIH